MPTRRAMISLLLILALAAIVYLAGTACVALWDRDEPRYAQASRQMLQSGDWVVPRFLDEPRAAKPILIYWLQASCMAMLGENELAARLPSIAATLALLAILAVALWRGVGPRRAVWTVLIFSTAALVAGWSARNALTDAVLLLWITIAQLCLYAIYRGSRSPGAVLFLWLAIGLGILTKGPFILGILATTILALATLDVGHAWRTWRAWRDAFAWLRRTRPLVGILIAAAVVAPWFITAWRKNPGFIEAMLAEPGKHMGPRADKHAGPPGYYLLTIWGTFLPWSLFLPMAIIFGFRHRRLAPLRYALAMVLGPWIFVELWKTKLPHYLLPAYPALALLTADALIRCFRRQYDDVYRRSFLIAAGIWALAIAAIGAATWLPLLSFDRIPTASAAAVTAFGLLYATAVFTLFARRRAVAAAVTMGVGVMIALTLFWTWYLPAADFIRTPIAIARVLPHGQAAPGNSVQMIGYKEPSLAWYQGGTVREQSDNDYLAKLPVEKWPNYIVIRADIWGKMPQRVKDSADIVATFRGLAYADGGRIRTVLVIRPRQR